MTDHLYTNDINEIERQLKDQVGRYGYISEGTECLLYTKQVKGSVPLYRYWNGCINDHFYTTDPDEIGVTTPGETGKYGYINQEIVGYCFPKAIAGKGLVPLHCYWKESFSDHFLHSQCQKARNNIFLDMWKEMDTYMRVLFLTQDSVTQPCLYINFVTQL